MIDTSLLPSLVALLEEESVSAAAVRAGVTQPAMSRTLARLRDALGDELLVKVGRGLQPTSRAKDLLPRARVALAEATAVLRPPTAFDAKTATGTVTLALGEDMQQMAGAAILLELRKRAPGLDVRLRILGPHTATEARRGDVNLAVMPKLTPAELPNLSDFVLKLLYERRFVTVGRRKKRPTLDEFCALDHVLVSFGGDAFGYVDAALAKLGRKRRVAITVQGFGTALQVLARSDDLIGTLPHDVCRALAKHLPTWPCPVETPRFPMCLAWLARDTHAERHRFIRDHVRAAVLSAVA